MMGQNPPLERLEQVIAYFEGVAAEYGEVPQVTEALKKCRCRRNVLLIIRRNIDPSVRYQQALENMQPDASYAQLTAAYELLLSLLSEKGADYLDVMLRVRECNDRMTQLEQQPVHETEPESAAVPAEVQPQNIPQPITPPQNMQPNYKQAASNWMETGAATAAMLQEKFKSAGKKLETMINEGNAEQTFANIKETGAATAAKLHEKFKGVTKKLESMMGTAPANDYFPPIEEEVIDAEYEQVAPLERIVESIDVPIEPQPMQPSSQAPISVNPAMRMMDTVTPTTPPPPIPPIEQPKEVQEPVGFDPMKKLGGFLNKFKK